MPLGAVTSLNVPSPIVVQQHARQPARTASGGSRQRPVPSADRADGVRFPGPGEIPADVEIEPAIVVVIHERGARRPSRHGAPAAVVTSVNVPVAVVAEERVAAEAGDVKVDVAIVVVVRRRGAEVVAGTGNSRPFGDVLELPVRRGCDRADSRSADRACPAAGPSVVSAADCRAVGEEQIETTVSVSVEDRDTAAHRFRQKLDARLRRGVAERDAR